MLISLQGQIRPYFIGDNNAVISCINVHCFFNFLTGPYTSAGIMGRAEYGKMNMILLQLFIHVFIIHTPDAFFVTDEVTVDDFAAVAFQGAGKADICGRMEQHLSLIHI